jgi:pSer/pThr/pTyr-binding forkhead associated (FHA) protein
MFAPGASQSSSTENGLTLTIYIGNEGVTPIRLSVKEDALIGCADPAGNHYPDLDLSPYGGRDAGVSRRHAQLKVLDRMMYVMDIGSVNGSRLNDDPMVVARLYPLNNGDKLELATMRLIIYMG